MNKLIARQLSSPGRLVGWLAGLVWNRRNAALNEAVLPQLDLQPDDRVLEIGFGGGYLLRRMSGVLPEGLLAGVDVSPSIVASAKARLAGLVRAGRLDLQCAPVEALPYPDGHFTKACSVNSIFYWRDVTAAIAEIRRVLRPGGKLVLCFTCKESIREKSFATHIQLYEPDEIAALLAGQGFEGFHTTTLADRHRRYVILTGQIGAQAE